MNYSLDGLSALALEFGFSSVYFFVMRNQNNKKFKKIFSFDKEHKQSSLKYLDYVKQLMEKAELILERYEFETKLYGNTLKKHKLNVTKSHTGRIYSQDCKAVFKLREDKDFFAIRIETIERWEKIIKILGVNNECKC